jgi:hypothetical protein
MGLLDQFSNLNEDQTQGLLAAAAQMLQQSGPSRTPASFGQIAGGGMGAYQDSTLAARKRKLDEQQAAQLAEMRGLQMQEARGGLADRDSARAQAERLRQFYMKPAGGAPQGQQQAPALDSVPQQSMPGMPQQPGQPQGGGQPNVYSQRMGMAERLRAEGFPAEADEQEASALKFQPKVKNWQEVQSNGQVLFAPFFEDGTSGQPVPLEVARKLEKVDSGQSNDMVDPYTGKVRASIGKRQTLESLATERTAAAGRNQSASQFNERLNFDRQQPRGTIIQTDQGPMLADPRAGTARPVTGADGQALGPKARPVPTQIQKAYVENGSSLRKVQAALDAVEAYPDGLGVSNYLGDNIRQRTDPSGVNVRALVADIGSQKIHDRSGAAVTASETPRLKPFIPTATDNPATVRKKLKMFQAEYQAMQTEMEDMYSPDMGYRPLGKGGSETKPPAAPAPTMAAMPTANASNKGKTLKDHETGKRYQSNGMQWKEVN